jgi:hypothetical protein
MCTANQLLLGLLIVCQTLSGKGLSAVLADEKDSSGLSITIVRVENPDTVDIQIRIQMHLDEKAKCPVSLVSHYETNTGPHYDPIVIYLDHLGSERRYSVRLVADRDAVKKVIAVMEPGGNITHTINLSQWVRVKHISLREGDYAIQACYQSRDSDRLLPKSRKPGTAGSQQLLTSNESENSAPYWVGTVCSNTIKLRI